MKDCLEEQICELQRTVPPAFDCDARQAWLSACHTVLAGIGNPQKRMEYATNLAILWAVQSGGIGQDFTMRSLLGE